MHFSSCLSFLCISKLGKSPFEVILEVLFSKQSCFAVWGRSGSSLHICSVNSVTLTVISSILPQFMQHCFNTVQQLAPLSHTQDSHRILQLYFCPTVLYVFPLILQFKNVYISCSVCLSLSVWCDAECAVIACFLCGTAVEDEKKSNYTIRLTHHN